MRTIVIPATILLLLSACSHSAQRPTDETTMPVPATGSESSEVEEMVVTEMEESDEGEMTEDDDSSADNGPEERTIMLHSSNWAFSPSTITLQQGENVSLHLMGIEGNHGFAVPGLGIRSTMSQGESKVVNIPTDTPGTYEFFCNVPCGSGHRDMRGTIVIE